MSRIEDAMNKAALLREGALRPPVMQVEPLGAPGAAVTRPGPAVAKIRDLGRALQAELLRIDDPVLVGAQLGQHPVAEEYKKLKSLVLQRTRGESLLNTLLISSCLSEEGKSTTALNLALAMARDYDHTVLLVDCDLRRPSLHKSFNIQPESGLIQCLRDNLPLERALVKTGHGKLVFLPAGGVADDPSELLASDRMRQLVEEMKQRYPDRYVIFDTPPALMFADSQVLARLVDSLLFVVREGKTKPALIKETLAGFHNVKMLGVVYNDARLLDRNRKYHYDY